MEIQLSGTGEKVTRVKSLISQVAKVNTSVLITGQSGTGKEIAARVIHQQSDRHDKPFVPVNCAAIPADLLESELFGHEKGAFSGAYNTRIGRFEMVQEGTIFLDEIGDMPMPMQAKLLRVIQEKSFERIGSNKPIPFKARIIAATHQDLEERIKQQLFREDLFYRLNVFPIEMPSLQERLDDFENIVLDLIEYHKQRLNITIELDSRVYTQLKNIQWPGNIRELSNLIERLMVMYPEQVIMVNQLPEKYQEAQVDMKKFDQMSDVVIAAVNGDGTDKLDLKEVMKRIEINYIQEALDRNDWIVSHAAESLSLRRTTLIEKMKKYNLAR